MTSGAERGSTAWPLWRPALLERLRPRPPLAFGGCAVLLLGTVGVAGVESRAGFHAGLLFAMLCGLLISLLVHELGHAALDPLPGHRLLVLCLGPVRLWRTEAGFRTGTNDSWYTVGLTASLPGESAGDAEGERHRRIGDLLAYAAGPAASLAVGALAWAIFRAGGSPVVSRDLVAAGEVSLSTWFGREILFQVAVQSSFFGLVNLVPVRYFGIQSDGARMLALWRGAPAASRSAATRLLAGGRRPREWGVESLREELAAARTPGDAVFGHLAAYQRALDRGEHGAAENHLRAALQGACEHPRVRSALAAEAAYFAARHLGDAALARRYLALTTGTWVDRSATCRAAAALHLLEGRPDRARRCARRALADLRHPPALEAGTAVAEREWLIGIMTEAAADLVPGSAPRSDLAARA